MSFRGPTCAILRGVIGPGARSDISAQYDGRISYEQANGLEPKLSSPVGIRSQDSYCARLSNSAQSPSRPTLTSSGPFFVSAYR